LKDRERLMVELKIREFRVKLSGVDTFVTQKMACNSNSNIDLMFLKGQIHNVKIILS